MPALSIVIPVYNAEDSIRACLDSVCHQSLREIEVICVDDGSRDASVHVIQEYMKEDPRVRLIRQENQFAGVARNNGMKAAEGEWLFFLDADDSVLPHGLEGAYRLCIQNDLDCLKFPALTYNEEMGEYVQKVRNDFSLVGPGEYGRLLALEEDGTLQKISVAPWSGMYRKRFLEEHHIQFNSLRCVNDRSFYTRIITNHPRIMCSMSRVAVHRISAGGSLVDGKARYFECQVQSLLITERQLKEDHVSNEICQFVMRQEYRDFVFWYTKYGFDPEQRARMDQLIQDYLHSGETEYGGLLEAMICGLSIIQGGGGKDPVVRAVHQEAASPEVSVLIPVESMGWNVRMTLEKLYQQTEESMEFLVIHDGFSPELALLLQEYQDLDRRFVSLEQAKGDYFSLMERGLQQARGKYIGILRPGDLPEPEMFRVLAQEAGSFGLDGACATSAPWYFTSNHDLIQGTVYPSGGRLPGGKTICPAKDKSVFALPQGLRSGIFLTAVLRDAWVVARETELPELALWFSALSMGKRIRFLPIFVTSQEYMRPLPQGREDALASTYQALLRWLRKDPALCHQVEGALYARLYLDLLENWSHLPFSSRLSSLKRMQMELSQAYSSGQMDCSILSAPSRRRLDWIMKSPEQYLESVELSIVIPVWNEAETLDATLSTLLYQAEFSLEIICVDDGSTDASLKILRAFAEKDPRVKVISIPHSGAGAARNRGFSEVRGEYVLFLDANDIFESVMLNVALEKAQTEELDIAVLLSNRFDAQRGHLYDFRGFCADALPKERPFCPREDVNPFLMFERWVWDKLFRTSFLRENQLGFTELPCYNDLTFVYTALAAAKRVDVIDDYLLVHQRKAPGEPFLAQKCSGTSCFEALYSLRKELERLNLYKSMQEQYLNYTLTLSLLQISGATDAHAAELREAFASRWVYQLGLYNKNYLIFENEADRWILQRIHELSAEGLIQESAQRLRELSASEQMLKEEMPGSAPDHTGPLGSILPRKIRGGFRMLRTSGLRETIRYAKGIRS